MDFRCCYASPFRYSNAFPDELCGCGIFVASYVCSSSRQEEFLSLSSKWMSNWIMLSLYVLFLVHVFKACVVFDMKYFSKTIFNRPVVVQLLVERCPSPPKMLTRLTQIILGVLLKRLKIEEAFRCSCSCSFRRSVVGGCWYRGDVGGAQTAERNWWPLLWGQKSETPSQ